MGMHGIVIVCEYIAVWYDQYGWVVVIIVTNKGKQNKAHKANANEIIRTNAQDRVPT